MSAAFRNRELSVDREWLRPIAEIRALWPNAAFARLIAGRCRAIGCAVEADPVPGNPAHALILMPGLTNKELDLQARRLRDLADWPAT